MIAYVPNGDQQFVDQLLQNMAELYPERLENGRLLTLLQVFEPKGAWEDPEVREWIDHIDTADTARMKARLTKQIYKHYNKRAETLADTHPLGIQVCLNSGVANGVLVVRTVDDCASIIRAIILNELKFDITKHPQLEGYLLLRESVSGCVFRVMTGDKMLTNTFWNYYLNE